jgi:glycosyltransferase involved in cell wall biosynthesis
VRIVWQQCVFPVAAAKGGFDLIHAPGYVAPLATGLPVVLTVYDLIALEHPQWCRRSNRLHYRLLLPRSIRKAKRIIVPSAATGRDLVRRFPASGNVIRVIPPGVRQGLQPVREAGALEAVRNRYARGDRYVLFVGNLEPKKNIAGLIRAFHHLKAGGGIAHRLVIAGRRGWKCGDVFTQVRELGLAGEVDFAGFVPLRGLAALYSAADAFVFPSLYEGFGLPVLEAMACGTPVVASDRGALPEVVGDAGLLVDPRRPEDIARALRDVLSGAELRRTMIEKGLKRAGVYSWRKAAGETENVYAEAVGCASDREQPGP